MIPAGVEAGHVGRLGRSDAAEVHGGLDACRLAEPVEEEDAHRVRSGLELVDYDAYVGVRQVDCEGVAAAEVSHGRESLSFRCVEDLEADDDSVVCQIFAIFGRVNHKRNISLFDEVDVVEGYIPSLDFRYLEIFEFLP